MGKPPLRYMDICKQDLPLTELGTKEWETLTKDRDVWRYQVSQGIKEVENRRVSSAKEKSRRRKEGQ